MNFTATTSLNSALTHKIVFLGNSGVGKTSIVERIVHGNFDSHCQPTIILDTLRKNVIHEGKIHKLQLWDTAGQEKFSSLIPSSVRNNDCAIIVFDTSNPETLEGCERWLRLLQDNCAPDSSVILVGNKTDIRKVRSQKGFQFAVKFGLDYAEVSAATGEGIQKLIDQIISSINENGNQQKQTCSTESSGKLSTKTSFKMGSEKMTGSSEYNNKTRVELRKQNSFVLRAQGKNSCCSI